MNKQNNEQKIQEESVWEKSAKEPEKYRLSNHIV